MNVSPRVQSVLDRMAAFEASFNAQFAVDQATGELLHNLVSMVKPLHVLELGTWRGASAIYMADALQQLGRGHLITVEKSEANTRIARANIEEAGLTHFVTVVHQDVDDFLLADREKFDLVFIDAMKSKTATWLGLVLEKHVHARSRIIIDDVQKSREKMAGLFEVIAQQGLETEEYKVGNGILVVKPYVK